METTNSDKRMEPVETRRPLRRFLGSRLLEVAVTLFVLLLAINHVAGIIWGESALQRALKDAGMEHQNAEFTPDLR